MLKSIHIKTTSIMLKGCLLLLTVFILGCSKKKDSDPTIKDPVVLTFDKLEPVSEMSLFTIGGVQLISPKAIQNYLDRCYSLKTKAGDVFYQSKFIEPLTNDSGKSMFTFFNDGKIRYGAEIINVKKIGDTRIFKSIITNKIEEDPIITSELFKYRFDTNSNGTYNYQYVVHGDNRSLVVSLLYYKLVRYDEKGNLESLAFGTVHNELNEAFLKTLNQFDTLAVKAYQMKYSLK